MEHVVGDVGDAGRNKDALNPILPAERGRPDGRDGVVRPVRRHGRRQHKVRRSLAGIPRQCGHAARDGE